MVLLEETMILKCKRKGGKYQNKELSAEVARKVLLDYLQASGRENVIGKYQPLWLRHDRGAKKKTEGMTSHSFDKRLKHYAELAGVKDARIHRFRHTFARIVSEYTGSLSDTQEALDHTSKRNTEIYVQKIGIKKDKYSRQIAERLK